MKIKKFTATVVAIAVMLTLLVGTLSMTASAITSENGSITLNIADSATDTPMADVTYRLYLVARAVQRGNSFDFELLPPYDETNIDTDNLQDESLSVHLAHFAQSHSQSYTQKTSDANGQIVFDNLTAGLYLIVPVQTTDDYYVPSPFIISVPERNSENGSWEYNVVASPKINGDVPDGSQTTYMTVLKKWETDGTRPESITVVLLRDLRVYETIELNADNDWYHRWDNLPKDHIWDIVETQVPDGFTVSYDTSTNTVIITNRSESYEEPSTGPDSGSTTQPSDGEPDDELADTGQLNWPIPVLAISGLILFSIGWAVLNFGKKETE